MRSRERVRRTMTSDKDYRSGIARIAASLPLLASSWTLQQLLANFSRSRLIQIDEAKIPLSPRIVENVSRIILETNPWEKYTNIFTEKRESFPK